MTAKYYLAVADRLPDEIVWSITFPDFPGVTSVAVTFVEVTRQAKDALETAIEDMQRDSEALHASIEGGAIPDHDHSCLHEQRAIVVPVEVGVSGTHADDGSPQIP